jgi:hypothetical protein
MVKQKHHGDEREKGRGDLKSVLQWEDDGGSTLTVVHRQDDPGNLRESRHDDTAHEARRIRSLLGRRSLSASDGTSP